MLSIKIIKKFNLFFSASVRKNHCRLAVIIEMGGEKILRM